MGPCVIDDHRRPRHAENLIAKASVETLLWLCKTALLICPRRASSTARHRGKWSLRPMLAEEISENPCCSGNRESLGVFAPVRMTVGVRNNQRYPHEEPKAHDHPCHEANRDKRHSIRKQSHGRECEQNSRRYRPKHLRGRNPLRNEIGGSAKIERLFEGKGSDTNAEKNA